MSEISRKSGEDGTPGLKYSIKLEALAEALLDRDKDAMFFLGAGASISRTNPSLPTARELAKQLASESRLDWNEYLPLSTVAFYYESAFKRARLNKFLRELIASPNVPPSPTIRLLVQLIKRLEDEQINTLVVTTNYDQKFEEEYRQQLGKAPQVIVFRGATDPNDLSASLHDNLGRYQTRPQDWQPDRNCRTCLYKMHGCISEALGETRNLVITEEDYINFLANALSHDEKKQILRYVRGRIAMSTVLFIGYSLADWNFRVIYKATAETNRDHEGYAIQYFASTHTGLQMEIESLKWDNLIEFWERKSVSIINVDAATFMEDFLEAFTRRLPTHSSTSASL